MKKSYGMLKSDVVYVKKQSRISGISSDWWGEGVVLLNRAVREGLIEEMMKEQRWQGSGAEGVSSVQDKMFC